MSTFHPQQLPCQVRNPARNGSYNICFICDFPDDTTLVLRLPRVKGVSHQHADEKVIMEVEALDIIRKKTTIPVPEVKAWGRSKDNPLDLGPFLIMTFIHGTRLCDILTEPNSRLLKKDIEDSKIEFLYRQMARFMLQLFQIDFEHIGSLPTPCTGASVPIRPLTWKVHDILQAGGVNTFGDRTQGFATTTEYFQYLMQQDELQLHHQSNSIAGPSSARSGYTILKLLQSVLSNMINAEYDRGPFKLICDGFGLSNLIVKGQDDLTIVGLIDLEWVYSGPAQLFGSAPWWLLQDRPIMNPEWDFDGSGKAPEEVNGRYLKCLEIFIRVLEEEEVKMTGHQDRRSLSTLVKWSQTSGAMWLHMLLSSGFFDSLSFPFGHLKEHFDDQWWKSMTSKIMEGDDVKEFIDKKMIELGRYEKELENIERQKALMDDGKMTREEFMALAQPILAGGSNS